MEALVQHLGDHRLAEIFTECLGWDRSNATLGVCVDGQNLNFNSIAQKRGFQVLHCAASRLALIDRGLLRKVQRVVSKSFHEHILIYTSEAPRRQVWQWAVRLQDGRRLKHREHPFLSISPPSGFVTRLQGLRFTLDEEESASLVDALERVRLALDTTAELNLFAKRPVYARRSDELLNAVANGDPRAFHEFILFHRPLARHMSARYSRWYNLDPEDVEQIAIIGLQQAAHKYRRETGYQFSTYATWWIRQACQRHAPEAAMFVRVPPHILWEAFRLRRGATGALLEGGPARARQHIESALVEAPGLATRWHDFERVTNIRSLSDRNEPEYREARRLVDRHDGPLVNCIRTELRDTVRDTIDRLHPRDRQFLRWRYGIEGMPLTLEQIGRLAKVTRERVRQVLVKAEERLRRWLGNALPEFAPAATEHPSAPSDDEEDEDADDTSCHSEATNSAAESMQLHHPHRGPAEGRVEVDLQESRTQ